ncbi:MAG: hypothetical protein JWL76_1486 [Thermoleophilia bacterium]|nr:hypothetical protein [Thermoleophilia bacterium]
MNALNGRAAAGIAAGVAGLGTAVGVHLVMRGGSERTEAAAQAEWNAWKGELDAEFPKAGTGAGEARRPLLDDGDEQRFGEFLAEHPAPSWLNVKHEDLRAVSIDPFEPDPKGMDWKSFAAGTLGVGGGLGLGVAGAVLLERAGSAGSTLGMGLSVAGVTLGLGTIAGLFFLPRSSVYDQVASTEWNVPTHWTE